MPHASSHSRNALTAGMHPVGAWLLLGLLVAGFGGLLAPAAPPATAPGPAPQGTALTQTAGMPAYAVLPPGAAQPRLQEHTRDLQRVPPPALSASVHAALRSGGGQAQASSQAVAASVPALPRYCLYRTYRI